MDSLKKVLEVLRAHWEKVLLTLALVLLAGAVWSLYQASRKEEAKTADIPIDFQRRKVKGVQPMDLSRYKAVVAMAEKPESLVYSGPHNLVNPVKWLKKPDGSLLKVITGTEGTLDEVEVVRITPLRFIIALDRVSLPGYHITITNEVAFGAARRIAQYATVNSQTLRVFTLREVRGSAEEPELILELKDTGERISIAKDKPYVRVDAYEADLRYKIENKTFTKQRVGATLRFGGEDYNIVAINASEVVLSARLNDKKYTVRQSAQQ
jgi:hypothetical protein